MNIAHRSHTSSSGKGAQPSNSFATVYNTYTEHDSRLRLRCCSDQFSSLYVGNFTFPNGEVPDITDDYPQDSTIIYTHNGCIVLNYHNTITPDAIGIYTCTIPDSEGNLRQQHIGVYNEGFNSE